MARSSYLLIFCTLAISAPQVAFCQNSAGEGSHDYEVLPDGNILDRAPTPEALAKFVAKSRANFVSFKAGTFDMGDWGPEVNEGGLPFDGFDSKPLHKVHLDAFSISKYPITYAEFDLFTASLRLPRINQEDVLEIFRKPNNPAGVTWQGAHDYCKWLGKLTKLPLELPTEAQWEYAARSGGKRLLYATDNGKYEPGRNLPAQQWGMESTGLPPVDSFPPNPAGVYYMGAGVHEWTNDWYDKDYYARSPSKNPKGPETGATRVVRGENGAGEREFTFKRWDEAPKEQTGTWTIYSQERGKPNRKIPFTRYSYSTNTVFRCAAN